MKRMEFLKSVVAGGFLISGGNMVSQFFELFDDEVEFRFIVASDGHYGQPGTDYHKYFSVIVKKINTYNALFPSQFVVYNGDIIHDDPAFLDDAFKALSKSSLPFYVTKGNHDMVSPEVWKKQWGYSQNHAVSMDDRLVLLGTSSNEKGDYLCPDIRWFERKLERYKTAKEIYIFLHITPDDWTNNGVACPEFHNLLNSYPNISAVFNGHDHDQDGVKMKNGIPFMFNGHFGGNWGTDYKGFRVVERLKNGSLRTYMMDPDHRLNERKFDLKRENSRK